MTTKTAAGLAEAPAGLSAGSPCPCAGITAIARVEARNKQIADDYAKAQQLRAKEKAAAKRAHKKVTGSDPKKAPPIEAVGGEYPTREAAETALKALEQEKAKEHEGNSKQEPKPGHPGPG